MRMKIAYAALSALHVLDVGEGDARRALARIIEIKLVSWRDTRHRRRDPRRCWSRWRQQIRPASCARPRRSSAPSGTPPARNRPAGRIRPSSRTFSTSSCSGPTTPTSAGEPSSGRNTCTTPSSAMSCSACFSFLAFIASMQPHAAQDFRREVRHADEIRAPRLRSACRRCAACRGWGCRPCRRQRPHRRCARSCAKKNTRRRRRHRLAGAHLLDLHAARELAGAKPHEGDAVAVVRDPCSPGS